MMIDRFDLPRFSSARRTSFKPSPRPPKVSPPISRNERRDNPSQKLCETFGKVCMFELSSGEPRSLPVRAAGEPGGELGQAAAREHSGSSIPVYMSSSARGELFRVFWGGLFYESDSGAGGSQIPNPERPDNSGAVSLTREIPLAGSLRRGRTGRLRDFSPNP